MSHTGLPFFTLPEKIVMIVVRTIQLQSLVILNVTHNSQDDDYHKAF